MTALAAAVLLASLAVTQCRPQDVVFPDSFSGSSSTQLPSPTQPTQSASSTPASIGDVTTTRIPPRDPGNRIVYKVSCDCTFTYEYSPVCGTDGQTYGNMGVLQCAIKCGTRVELYLQGACGKNNG